ncbi:hypothetical protein GCM10023168_11780 [Fodinibacter luteus]|uniref:Class F sortase n=1 Tax=Fodinibacter luteus TaxID=552064 RepID=A0ABP8K805_9MICO
MNRRPLLAVGVALTVLAVALLTWMMQRDGESVSATAATLAPSAPPTVTPGTTTPSPTPTTSATSASPKPSATASKPPSAAGLRIQIPAIDLDHRMAGGGLSSNGTIDPDPGTVMWFRGYDRVRPGRVGTAVIAAHVATGSRPDVFADLADVGVGDTVKVVEDGKSITYRVTRAAAIDKVKVTTDQTVWGPNSSRSRLAIITCDDAFGFRGDGHRKANFVVIAERV